MLMRGENKIKRIDMAVKDKKKDIKINRLCRNQSFFI